MISGFSCIRVVRPWCFDLCKLTGSPLCIAVEHNAPAVCLSSASSWSTRLGIFLDLQRWTLADIIARQKDFEGFDM